MEGFVRNYMSTGSENKDIISLCLSKRDYASTIYTICGYEQVIRYFNTYMGYVTFSVVNANTDMLHVHYRKV